LTRCIHVVAGTPPRAHCGIASCQRGALNAVRVHCRKAHAAGLAQLSARCIGLGYTVDDLTQTLDYIRERAPLVREGTGKR